MLATLAFLRQQLALGCIKTSPRAGVNGRVGGQEDRLYLLNNRLPGSDIRVPHIRLNCLPVWGYTQRLSNSRICEA